MSAGVIAATMLAQRNNGGAGGGGGGGGTELASFDFINAAYTISGSTVVLGDNITNPDPSTLQSANNASTIDGTNGLYNGNTGLSTATSVMLAGALKALVIGTGAPLVLYFEVYIPSVSTLKFTFFETHGGTNDFSMSAENDAGSGTIGGNDANGPDSITDSSASLDVVTKFAMRIGSDTYRLCVDGGTVQVGTMGSPVALSDGEFRIRFANYQSPYVRVMKVYADKTDSELQTLTA